MYSCNTGAAWCLLPQRWVLIFSAIQLVASLVRGSVPTSFLYYRLCLWFVLFLATEYNPPKITKSCHSFNHSQILLHAWIQNWYADDSSCAAMQAHWSLWLVCYLGPKYGFHPEPEKCILIVDAEHEAEAKSVFQHLGIKVVNGYTAS